MNKLARLAPSARYKYKFIMNLYVRSLITPHTNEILQIPLSPPIPYYAFYINKDNNIYHMH